MGIAPASIAMVQTTAPAGGAARALTLITVTITTTLAPRGRTGTG
jgi:hypothetical protein